MPVPSPWPDGVDVLMLPEDADKRLPDEVSDRSLHPSEQIDIAKMFRASGFSCHFVSEDDWAEVSRKSDSFWLGVIMFTADALSNGAGNLLADYFKARFGGLARDTRVYGKISVVETDQGSIRTFESDGLSGEEWLDALDKLIGGGDGGS